MTMTLRYLDFIITEMKLFHKNVHMKIITGKQISRTGTITWHSKWKRLPTVGLLRTTSAAGGGGSGIFFFLLLRLYWSLAPSVVICATSYLITVLKHQIRSVAYIWLILFELGVCLQCICKNTRFKIWTNRLVKRTDDWVDQDFFG
jgi:hypothetical protein